MARPGRGLATIATLGVLVASPAARADSLNFDMSGKIRSSKLRMMSLTSSSLTDAASSPATYT